ncbi:MAG: SRPBCC domain-containing protein [Dehalococcoidia bacterium]
MVQSPSAAGVIEKEVRIAARPDLVYEYLTDAHKLATWVSPDVVADSRPGGTVRFNFNGFDVMRGAFVELVPGKRVVFTWGWESLGDASPPGSTTVEIDLVADGEGTKLTLVHRGLPAAESASHSEGWDHFLESLQQGLKEEATPSIDLAAGAAKAAQINTRLIELRYLVEGASEHAWRSTTAAEGWPVAATAHHVVAHCAGLRALDLILQGKPKDFEALAVDTPRANAEHAAQFANVSKADVSQAVRDSGPTAVEFVRGLSDADLAQSHPYAFAGGAEMSVGQLVDGLSSSMADHVESVKQALLGA